MHPAMLRRASTATIARASCFMKKSPCHDGLTIYMWSNRLSSAEKSHCRICWIVSSAGRCNHNRRPSEKLRIMRQFSSPKSLSRGYQTTVANMLHSEKSTRHAHKFAADKAEHGCPSGENRCKWRRRSRITQMLPRLFCWSRREYDGVEAEAGATQARLTGLFSVSFDQGLGILRQDELPGAMGGR